jgi:hypothetical protein
MSELNRRAYLAADSARHVREREGERTRAPLCGTRTNGNTLAHYTRCCWNRATLAIWINVGSLPGQVFLFTTHLTMKGSSSWRRALARTSTLHRVVLSVCKKYSRRGAPAGLGALQTLAKAKTDPQKGQKRPRDQLANTSPQALTCANPPSMAYLSALNACPRVGECDRGLC